MESELNISKNKLTIGIISTIALIVSKIFFTIYIEDFFEVYTIQSSILYVILYGYLYLSILFTIKKLIINYTKLISIFNIIITLEAIIISTEILVIVFPYAKILISIVTLINFVLKIAFIINIFRSEYNEIFVVQKLRKFYIAQIIYFISIVIGAAIFYIVFITNNNEMYLNNFESFVSITSVIPFVFLVMYFNEVKNNYLINEN